MSWTIIDVEKQTGIASRKIRFWADKGLFPFIQSDKNGIRYFAKSDVAWVEWVNCLRNCGMSIEDIKRYIELSRGGIDTACERRDLLERQFKILTEQLEILNAAHKRIEGKIAMYNEMIEGGIDFLNPSSKDYSIKKKAAKSAQNKAQTKPKKS